MAASVQVIQNQIDNALVNTEGEVNYDGANGQKAILTNLNEGIRDKGTIIIEADANGNPNSGALASLGGADARFAFVVGDGFYKWVPKGNTWALVARAVLAPVISALGAGNLSTTVNHNLNTDFPDISVWRKSATVSGFPYTEIKNTTNVVVDSDNITVTFPATTSLPHLIVVKP